MNTRGASTDALVVSLAFPIVASIIHRFDGQPRASRALRNGLTRPAAAVGAPSFAMAPAVAGHSQSSVWAEMAAKLLCSLGLGGLASARQYARSTGSTGAIAPSRSSPSNHQGHRRQRMTTAGIHRGS